MVPTRRQFLSLLGGGLSMLASSPLVSADNERRVFIHPRDGLIGDLLGALDAVGGTVRYEYEHFPFIAASVPETELDSLRTDLRVSLLEDDNDLGIPSGWLPSLGDILDPGGEVDCSLHPDQDVSWGLERIGADTVAVDGEGISIGILDTGIETDHCSLSVAGGRNVIDPLSPQDYDDQHGHGTHVAGVVGALDNDLGVLGVASGASLYAVKVLDDSGAGSYSSLLAGIDWCLSNEIELISMSLGGESESESVDQAIEMAVEAGHLLLCSAGNNENAGDGACSEETMTYPATHEDVVSVVAMDPDDSLAAYSSIGANIDLLAPGTDIRSTYVRNRYASASGTSVACPFVTGVAALVWQDRYEPGPGPQADVRAVLTETAESVLGTCEEGNGLVDARAAVQRTTSDDEDTGGPPDNGGGTIDPRDPASTVEELPWWTIPGAVGGTATIGYALKRHLSGKRE